MRKERSDGIANVMSVRNRKPASVRLGVRETALCARKEFDATLPSYGTLTRHTSNPKIQAFRIFKNHFKNYCKNFKIVIYL